MKRCFMNKCVAMLLALFAAGFGGVVWAARSPQWISGESVSPKCPAPVLVKSFVGDGSSGKVTLDLAVAGWCEVRLNGAKIGRDVLTPVTCQPDRRISRLVWNLTDHVRTGTNELEVLLGNGWWNAFTKTPWMFAEAPWVSAPKICGSLRADGRTVCVTDSSWQAYDSPIVFNSLRNGEWYDARMEGLRPRLRKVGVERYAPAGVVSDEDAQPCRVCDTLEPVKELKAPDGMKVYDFGANISGWCAIEVEGPSGSKVCLDYDESLTPSNSLLGHVAIYVKGRGDPFPVQHDEYTLAGRAGGESWEPRFTFHGFRYVKVTATGGARVKSIRARFVYSDFPRAGSMDVSDATFAALQDSTMRSYLSNFVGIPTDCPHREKNGWTGDAQLVTETGLWNFDAKAGYVHFLRMLLDSQRPNGAVPCILPHSPGFGFYWGSGPAWDAILFEIPRQIFRFYGDDAPAREAYGAMKRYRSFIMQQADEDGLIAYGLGDWCCPVSERRTPLRLTDSAYVYHFNRELAFWARRFCENGVASECDAAADRIAAAFNKAFYRGDGLYAKGELTALAAPLYFAGLCAPGEERKVVRRLVDKARELKHVADFGILGAKWVLRVLSDHGYIDDAWTFFTQKKQPGWAHWLQFGDGTLCERWDRSTSRNHVMFGDLSAWAYEYLGGIKIAQPGFRAVRIEPSFPKGLERFSASHDTPFGEITVEWHRKDGVPVVKYDVPRGITVLTDVK